MLTVGSRLTDFATGSHSLFANPDVRFASINVNVHDADRLGATGIVGDAKRALAALADGAAARRARTARRWRDQVRAADARRWAAGAGGRAGPGPARSTSARSPPTSDVVTDHRRACSPRARSSASCRSTPGPAT